MDTIYWINAETNPPKENERIIGLDRHNVPHPLIFKNGWYYFDCDYPYAANSLIFPIWYIPTPMFENDNKKEATDNE